MAKAWTTEHEIKFIASLGTGRWKKGLGPSRKELLQRYLESLNLRRVWDGIDREVVEEYARTLLEACYD